MSMNVMHQPDSPRNVPFLTMRPVRLATAVAVALLLAACASAPQRELKTTEVPARWYEDAAAAQVRAAGAAASAQPAAASAASTPTQGPAPSSAWWREVAGPEATAWVEMALAQSPQAQVAALATQSARLRAGAAQEALLPRPTGGPTAQVSRSFLVTQPATQRSVGTSIGASWEIDLWGRLALQNEMAQQDAQATFDDERAARSALAAQVLRELWGWISLRERRASAAASLANAERTFEMTKTQYRAGVISGLDMAQAEQAMTNQRLGLAAQDQQIVSARHNLSLLLGLEPGHLPAGAEAIGLPRGRLIAIDPGLPASLLARRPDLQAAEGRLRNALGAVDDSRLSFYPTLNLSATITTGGPTLAKVLANPAGLLSLIPAWNIIGNWQEMQRAPKIAQLSYETAVVNFRQTLHRALADVETALASLASLQAQTAQQQSQLAQARRIERMTEVRYKAGAIALRDWLAAQDALRSAEQAALDADLQLLLAQVQLLQSLGGSAS